MALIDFTRSVTGLTAKSLSNDQAGYPVHVAKGGPCDLHIRKESLQGDEAPFSCKVDDTGDLLGFASIL